MCDLRARMLTQLNVASQNMPKTMHFNYFIALILKLRRICDNSWARRHVDLHVHVYVGVHVLVIDENRFDTCMAASTRIP